MSTVTFDDPYLCVLSYELGNYLSDQPQKDILPLKALLKTKMKGASVLVIKGNEGNGRTHLLSGMAKELSRDGKNIVCISSEKLLAGIQSKANKDFLLAAPHCLIDDFNFLLKPVSNESHMLLKKEAQGTLHTYLRSGGKLILTCEKQTKFANITRLIGKHPMQSICTAFPSPETLRKIAQPIFPDEIITAYHNYACQKCESSVRFILIF